MKQAIMDKIAACGPQEIRDLKHECLWQATDYHADAFLPTLDQMIVDGMVVQDGDTIDFPEIYYKGK